MSELRYNPPTKEWVIIATDRAKRPEDFKIAKPPLSSDTKEKCPFCPGHESKTPAELFCLRDPGTAPNTTGWRVRVVPNQFPALTPDGNKERKILDEFYMSMDGFGEHSVIIENPDHNLSLYTMTPSQVEEVFAAYRERYIALASDKKYECVILFKNHGFNAGTSLSHPHSQMVAMPVIPLVLRYRVDVGRNFFDIYGQCIYCRMIEEEKKAKTRVVYESDNFIAFELFASHFPFETMIMPKWHTSDFKAITKEQCRELAATMQTVLKKLNIALNGPDYNYMLAVAPSHESELAYFHWFFKIVPRISKSAGFELGSGVFINTVVPEQAAKYLREA